MFKAAKQMMKTITKNANTKVLAKNMSSIGRNASKFNAAGRSRGVNTLFGKNRSNRITHTQYATDVDDVMRAGKNKGMQMYNAVRPVIKPVAYAGMMALGATAMTGVAVMNGAMSAASDSMATRYMKDSRYSSKVLQNRVGRAHGNGNLNIGNHAGLSLSMSKARHG